MTTYRAQLTRRPGVGWTLFVVLPGRVADWPTTDFLTIDGNPPTIAGRDRALEQLGYRLAGPGAVWEWMETQDGAECSPQEGVAPVVLSAVAMVRQADGETPIEARCAACRKPFEPGDTRWDGQNTDWCRSCVDRCHDNESADHRCAVCR